MMHSFFQHNGQTGQEIVYCVETSAPLTGSEKANLMWVLAETYEPQFTTEDPFQHDTGSILIGPRPAVETAFSSNAVAICNAIGLQKIQRIEQIRRLKKKEGVGVHHLYDRMTECLYEQLPETFHVSITPEPVCGIPLIEHGIDALKEINKTMGLGMDAWDLSFYYDLFTNKFKRNPTNVECFQLGQANSEHCRHWYFKGKIEIDGVVQTLSLMDLVKLPLQEKGKSNSVIAFSDNSSAIRGFTIKTIVPHNPGKPSSFTESTRTYHIIFTAETHNHPTMIQAFRGAETGTGGRIRDDQATGRGGLVVAGTAGYCVGNLLIPEYTIPGENKKFIYPTKYMRPLQILIDASNGASDYGNKFGEPVINGFVRSFGLQLPSGERREWIKPIMFTGGIGQIDDLHLKKEQPAEAMVIVQIGGPAYRIGLGGGAASSMMQGQNTEELDFNSVQRGNAQMAQKVNRVIRACVELGEKNPIVSIHDQGAGGPCNVVTELVDPAGGKVNIRAINVGDTSMSVLEIWGAEYQERLALLLRHEQLGIFLQFCRNESVPCEILGNVTNDGTITVRDSDDGSTPVQLSLEKILGKMPQKTFSFSRIHQELKPFTVPYDISVDYILQQMFRLPSVGSKGFLVRKVDRSVTGLVAQQQCCGPLHLPVANVAVTAQSHLGLTGMATANGEQPIKMLLDPKAGARMAIAEMLMNIVWVKSEGLSAIKSSWNWMWPAKMEGEGALLYDAALAGTRMLCELQGAEVDGGKDSLTMAATVDGEKVKSPPQLVVSGYVSVPDITKKVTPDLKSVDNYLMFIDLSNGKKRLGGSAIAQVFGEIGDESPDVEDPLFLKNAFAAIQELIDKGLILSGHDKSDGGLLTTLVEMALSGNKGIEASFECSEPIPLLFNEEIGVVIEYTAENIDDIHEVLRNHGLESLYQIIGKTTRKQSVIVRVDNQVCFSKDLYMLRDWWESTSDKIESLQMNPRCAEEAMNANRQTPPKHYLSFSPKKTNDEWMKANNKPKVAIIRAEGSNGDREMAAAFYAAGFEPHDINMQHLMDGLVTLEQFRGVAFVGGFSYADVFGSAKGWAAIIRTNPALQKMFSDFYSRPDTFSLGVCNGCQLMALLGWVPGMVEKEVQQPRFIHNTSGRFESNWVQVKIAPSPSIMLKGMEGSVLGVWVAHGEGKVFFPDPSIEEYVHEHNLAPIHYADRNGMPTERYPFNPNGSPGGITALCSPNGRHLALMPHPERSFLKWQLAYVPFGWESFEVSPWLQMFQNARTWCSSF